MYVLKSKSAISEKICMLELNSRDHLLYKPHIQKNKSITLLELSIYAIKCHFKLSRTTVTGNYRHVSDNTNETCIEHYKVIYGVIINWGQMRLMRGGSF